MTRRTTARVKPYGLQHESVVGREPSGRSLRFFRDFLPVCIIVKPFYVYCVQARVSAHRTLGLDLESPLLSALLCAGETQAQGIVMVEYGLQSAHQMLQLQIGRDLQHNRLAEAIQRAT